MSIEHEAVIVFGLPKDEIGVEPCSSGFYDKAGLLEFYPTRYDGSKGIVGIELQRVESNFVEIPSIFDIYDHIHTFRNIIGKDGRLFLTTHSY